jgi:PAS domain-containing protein
MEQTKQTDEQHVGDEIFLASIVESSDDAIFAMSLGGTVLSWNSGAQEMYGYDAAEIVGKPASLLCPADRVPEIARNLERLKRGVAAAEFGLVQPMNASSSSRHCEMGGIFAPRLSRERIMELG